MSEQSQESLEKEKIVAITPEDCNAALDFWKNFQIDVPPALQDAFDGFALQPNFENQQRVKLEICKHIATSEHVAFQDEMFSKIKESCNTIAYDMQFDKDLESTLTVDPSINSTEK